MLARVVAFLVALVLLGSGISAAGPRAAADPARPAILLQADAGGDVQHAVESQPTQPSPADPMNEGPALLPAPLAAHAAAAAAAPPRQLDALARRAPYLDGPLRPPRSA